MKQFAQIVYRRLRATSAFSPVRLFTNGEIGAWYDPSDFTTMFQDSAGTTPVTAVGQKVGLILDKSGNSNHASQSTSISRPTLSARVNLLTYSEQFDNAAWTKTRCTVVPNDQNSPDGTLTMDRFNCDTTSANGFYVWRTGSTVTVPASTNLTVSIVSKKGSRNQCRLDFYSDTTGNNGAYSYFNLDTGAYVSSSPFGTGVSIVGTPTISSLGSGLYRMTMVVTSNTTTGNFAFIPSLTSSSDLSCTSGVDFGYAWGADLRPADQVNAGMPNYQRIAAATDYDTTGFPYYLSFDGTDDFLVTGTINPGSVDKAQVFAGVRKLSDAADRGLLDYGPSWATQTGSFGLYAPSYRVGGLPAPKYATSLKGSTGVREEEYANYTAPITNVLAISYDIGAVSVSEVVTRINGGAVSASAAGGDAGGGNFSSLALQVGRYGNAPSFNGHLYSLIVRFSAANLSDAQIAQVEDWMDVKTFGKDMAVVYSDELTTALGELITAADGDQIYMTVAYV